jgi:MFS family permease
MLVPAEWLRHAVVHGIIAGAEVVMSQGSAHRVLSSIVVDRSLASVLAGTFVLRCAAGAMGVMIQFYLEHISQNVYRISNTEGGLIIATFFAAELLGAPVFGALSDRYGRKPYIILGPLFGAIAVQLTALTTVVWVLVFTRLLEGLSTAANAPATLGYLSESTSGSPTLRGRASGFFEVATVGGMAAGLWLGGRLWEIWGRPASLSFVHLTSPAFAIDAIVYAISLVIFAVGLRETVMSRGTAVTESTGAAVGATLRRYWRVLASPRVLRFVPAWLAINAVLGVWLNHLGRQLTRSRDFADQLLTGGFTAGSAGTAFALFALVFAGGILIWGLALGRLRKTAVMLIATGGLMLSCVALLWLNHLPSMQDPSVVPFGVLFAAGLLIMSGFTPAALAYLADITEDYVNDRGAIMGLYSVFLGVGQFLGASLGGPFADWRGMDGIILVTFLLGLIAAGTVALLVRSEAHPQHSDVARGLDSQR